MVVAAGACALVAATVAAQDAPPDVVEAKRGVDGVCNTHFTNSLTFSIPGRGLALSWAPAGSAVNGGHAIAVGGHLIGSQTYLSGGERYDTKIYDTTTGQYLKRFGAHWWWAVSNAWAMNPFVGEVIADGAGDHAAKIFLADHPGTNLGPLMNSNVRGRYAVEDGALPGVIAAYGRGAAGLEDINAWIVALAFSPDGAYLAGASKDGTIRIWQITDQVHPEDQFRVVKVLYDPHFGPTITVRWSPDGTMLAAGSKSGNVWIYKFDPAVNRWDESMIAEFKDVRFTAEMGWLHQHLADTNAAGQPAIDDVPVWTRTGLNVVWNVRYSPDGVYLAAAGRRASKVWDLADGSETALVTDGHGLDFSPDGSLIAVGGPDGLVYVYAETGASPPFALWDRLQAHTEPVVGAVAWSPDGATLASVAGGPLLAGPDFNQQVQGDDDHVRLWTRGDGAGVPCTPVTTTTTRTTTTSTTSDASTSTSSTAAPSTTTTTLPDGPAGAYPGFGRMTTGGAGHPTFVVTNSNDSGAGSLRDALAKADHAGGGIIRFAVTDSGDLHPGRTPLVVPANTTIDATGSHITLWGGNESGSNGLLNVWNSNVIVVGLRIRNGVNDGIQIEPKTGDVENVVVDRCSLTKNADGAIDVTGRHGFTVSKVTIMRNFIAGTGRYCFKGLCGGGSLFKYGAHEGSYYGNYFFSNLERDPLISAAGSSVPVVADLRYNLAEGTQSSSMSVRQGASANVVGNFFSGPRDGALVWSGAFAYFGGGNVNQKPDPRRELSAPLPVPALPAAFTLDQVRGAGAQPRDSIDACYLALGTQGTFGTFRSAPCVPGIAADPAPRRHRRGRR